mgnify:CR=1 FL=1
MDLKRDDPAEERNNLTKRCVCKECHQTLEKAGAHWGRWRVNSHWGYMGDGYPNYRDYETECKARCPAQKTNETKAQRDFRAANNAFCVWHCKPYYLTESEFLADPNIEPIDRTYYEKHVGKHKATYWFENSAGELPDDITQAFDDGPRGLVMKHLTLDINNNNDLARCTTRRMAQHLLGRDITAAEESSWLTDKTSEFVDSNYSFKDMIKSIILDPLYQQNR